jgi:hypothetical protein
MSLPTADASALLASLPLETVDAFLRDNDAVRLGLEQRLASFAVLRVPGAAGLRGLVLQGRPDIRALVQDLAAGGASLAETGREEDEEGEQAGGPASVRVTFAARVPMSFSPAHAVRLSDGAELRLGRVLGAFEAAILYATWAALLVVAVLFFVPRFPGRRSLAVALLVLVVLSIGLSYAFTGNFGISLGGVGMALEGSAALTATVEVTARAGEEGIAGGAPVPVRLRVRGVALEEQQGGTLALVASGLPVPDFALAMLRDLGLQAARSALAGVNLEVEL